MCTFSLATTERYKGREKTEWHNVVAFGNQATVIAEHCSKGTKLLITGRLQTRKWQDSDGNDRYTTEIMLRDFEFVGRKQDAYDEPHTPQSGTVDDSFDDQIPF